MDKTVEKIKLDLRSPFSPEPNSLVQLLLSKLKAMEKSLDKLLAVDTFGVPESTYTELLITVVKQVYIEWINGGLADSNQNGAITIDQVAFFEGSTQVIDYLVKLLFDTTLNDVIEITRPDGSIVRIESHTTEKPSVLIAPPTYFGLLKALGDTAEILQVPTKLEDGHKITKEFKERVKATLSEKDKAPYVFWFCSPNNPTGISWTLEDIEEILISAKYTWVIVDQAFLDLIDPDNKNSAAQLIAKYPNLIVTRAFSKGFGLPDDFGKLGAVIAHPTVITALKQLREKGNIRLKSESLLLALNALFDADHLRGNTRKLQEEISFFYDQLKQINAKCNKPFEVIDDSETGVILMRATLGRNLLELFEMLENLEIKVLDANHNLGIEFEQWVRVCLQDPNTNALFIAGLLEIAKKIALEE